LNYLETLVDEAIVGLHAAGAAIECCSYRLLDILLCDIVVAAVAGVRNWSGSCLKSRYSRLLIAFSFFLPSASCENACVRTTRKTSTTTLKCACRFVSEHISFLLFSNPACEKPGNSNFFFLASLFFVILIVDLVMYSRVVSVLFAAQRFERTQTTSTRKTTLLKSILYW
jgi:hypothetical protein